MLLNNVNEYIHNGYHVTFNSISELEKAKENMESFMLKIFEQKKVLVVGIHGFLGSNLCKFLIKNANVYGLHN